MGPLAAGVANAGATGSGAAPPTIEAFLRAFDGEFDSRDQVADEARLCVAAELRHAVAHFSLVSVTVAGLGPATYVEQNRDGRPENVVYQRLFVHAWDPATREVVSRIYELPGTPTVRRGAVAELDPATLKPLPEGCAIRWRAHRFEFRGRQSPATCRRESGGRLVVYSDALLLSATEFWTNTRIALPDGTVLRQNGGGVPLKMRRVGSDDDER